MVLIGFHLLGRLGRIAAIGWLTAASLVFYAYWNKAFLLLLLRSIVLIFFALKRLSGAANPRVVATGILWTGIARNVGLLCYYKYWFPLLNSLGSLSYPEHYFGSVVLPLGISFFTLTQIGYLVDLQQGEANFLGLLDHLFFVSFFPHLIAGPILHHREFMPQVTKTRAFRLEWEDVAAAGSTWFVMGLFKKVVIADQSIGQCRPANAVRTTSLQGLVRRIELYRSTLLRFPDTQTWRSDWRGCSPSAFR